MKLIKALAVTSALLLAAYASLLASPYGEQLQVGAGMTAKQLCSLYFVSGLEPEQARELYIDPLLEGLESIFQTDIDPDNRTVTATVPGIAHQLALYRSGYGCTLVQGDAEALEASPFLEKKSPPWEINLAHRDVYFEPRQLQAALDTAFRGDPSRPPLNTLAIVVVHQGQLVAERYADGIDAETRLPGWSMTKAVTASVIGLLATQSRLDVYAPNALDEWRESDDPRAQISIDNLLRMTSGLLISEQHAGLDPNTRMLYLEADAANFAATRALQADIGSHFEYMSGSTILAMRKAQQIIEGELAADYQYLQQHFFSPLNMHSAVLEPDEAGTFIGSSSLYATARDWGRFGQLYMDRGRVNELQLIAPEWIDYVTRYTEQSGKAGFATGFWLRQDTDPGDSKFPTEQDRDAPAGFEDLPSQALPPGTYAATGFQGQHLHMVPSEQLVIVRLGASNRKHNHEQLPLNVIASLKGKP